MKTRICEKAWKKKYIKDELIRRIDDSLLRRNSKIKTNLVVLVTIYFYFLFMPIKFTDNF